MRAILVALPLAIPPLSYLPPHGEGVRLGARVVVPFRRQVRIGLVVGEERTGHAHALRHAIAYLDEEPFLDEKGLERLKLASRFLFAPLGQVVADFLPFIESPLVHEVRLVPGARPEGLDEKELKALSEWRPAKEHSPELLDALREGGVLEERVFEKVPTRRVLIPLRPPDDELGPAARKALLVLFELGAVSGQAELSRLAGVSTHATKRLIEKGYAGYREVPAYPEEEDPEVKRVRPLPLENPARVHGGSFAARMGVLRALAKKGRLLVLFPEGAEIERARAYLPEALVFTGALPAPLRRRLWRERKRSVLGSYQALFFPGEFFRVVVVEESAESHKLASGTRAFLPALAEALGLYPLYLGAAPSVHALYHARGRGKSYLLPSAKPRGMSVKKSPRQLLAGRTLALIKQALDRGRQVLVLAARRGYAARLRCTSCGYVPHCPNCALPLRFYKGRKRGELVCHQCGHREPAPPVCPQCQSELIEARGPGLDWLAEELRRRFPEAPVGRLSSSGAEVPSELREGKPGLLVATTRILRENPLKNLALVSLPWVEGFLPESDFYAAERLFSLLWRLKELVPGKNPFFVLEAYDPEHPAIKAFLAGELEAFPKGEMELREALGYPPFSRMVKLELSHKNEATVREAAGKLYEALAARVAADELLGPAPAPVPRVKGVYVWHLILKSKDPARLEAALKNLPAPNPARLRLDPDPVGFLGLLD